MTAGESWFFDGGSIVTESSNALFVVDTERTIAYANDRFVALSERSQQALAGADYAVVDEFLAAGVTQLLSVIEEVLAGEVNHECVEVVVTSSEQETTTRQSVREARVNPVVRDGQLGGALVVFHDRDAAQERVNETYQRYRALVEQNRDGVTITQDQTNVFVNNRFAEMLGYPKTELIGESFLKPIAPKDRDIVTERYEQRMRSNSPPNRYELTLETNRGESLPVAVNVTTIQYGGEQAVMATYRDISQRKKREEELRQFRRAIETAPHAILLTDADGTITYVNPAFEKITGYSRTEALGRTPQLYYSDEIPDSLHEELWETITSGEVWEGNIVNQRASGDLYHAHETVAPISPTDGEATGFVGIQTDISERVEREQLIDTLDRVLRHNLRNKLNVVQAHGSLIRTCRPDDPSDHIDKIMGSVDDLLETSQKGREIIKFLSNPSRNRPTDLITAVHNATKSVRETYAKSRITLDLPEEAPVSAVPEIDTALEELLTNAIVHNDQETPDVTVCVDGDGDTVELCVSDDGPGISTMEREILTETRDIDQLYHGSGFGLWLVYWIVRQSGGDISIGDRKPRGTTISVEFEPAAGTGAEPQTNLSSTRQEDYGNEDDP